MLKGRRHPVCTRCARVLSGIRPGYSIERKGPKNSAKKRRDALLLATAEEENTFAYFEPESAAAVEEGDAPRSRLHRLGRRSSRIKGEDSRSEAADDAANAPLPRKRVRAEQPMPAVDQLAQLREEQAASADHADAPPIVVLPTTEAQAEQGPTNSQGEAPPSVVEPVASETPLTTSIPDLTEETTHPEAEAAGPIADPDSGQKLMGRTSKPEASTPKAAEPASAEPEIAATADSTITEPETAEPEIAAIADLEPEPAIGEPESTEPEIADPASAAAAASGPDESRVPDTAMAVDEPAAEHPDVAPGIPANPKRTYPERRKGEQLKKQLGKPKTAPMIGEIQTIGGRRSTDAIQAETVIAAEQSPAVTGGPESGGVDSFDAHQAGLTPVATIIADDQSEEESEKESENEKVKHDVDAKGNWVPPILRGMAVDARKAAADLPKRRSS